MKKTYDFSQSIKNPYLRRPKKQLTIRIDEDTIEYFRELAEESGIPYQSLINLYLRECAANNRKLRMTWENAGTPTHCAKGKHVLRLSQGSN